MDLLETEYLSVNPLPPTSPPEGLNQRVRLAPDYYIRVDTADYALDPTLIGRFIDVVASPSQIIVFCNGKIVARHDRSWAKQGVVNDQAAW